MLTRKLENEQGDLTQFRERQAKAAAQKADLEVQLEENRDKLEEQSEQRQQLSAEKQGLEHEVSSIKKEVSELEDRISKSEAEKTSRDHAMRSLNDEIANQDEMISKLNKVLYSHFYILVCLINEESLYFIICLICPFPSTYQYFVCFRKRNSS
jgi:chromosome segregation ATPase